MNSWEDRTSHVEEEKYPGPTATGVWAQNIPEHTEFTGEIIGEQGRFYKSPRSILQMRSDGRGLEIEYWRQMGLWVENYKAVA